MQTTVATKPGKKKQRQSEAQSTAVSSRSAEPEFGTFAGVPLFLRAKLSISQPGDPYEQEADRVADQIMRMPVPRVQRQCAACEAGGSLWRACEEEESVAVSRKASGPAGLDAPASVRSVVGSSGAPLPASTRAFFEPRFGMDLGHVRVHTDGAAQQSARDVNALAYTVGSHVVFGVGRYAPSSTEGRQLLAHELTHVVQQAGLGESRRGKDGEPPNSSSISSTSVSVARLCTPAATCSAPILGSAEDFGTGEEAIEAGPRARRKRMTPARAVSTGHAGRALQLERFLAGQDPTRLGNIQGIFIDHDMSSGTEAFTQNCAAWIRDSLPTGAPTPPGMAGGRECTFVHGRLNQEGLIFNTSAAPTIGGRSRERWRIDTLQTLTHETEHPRFETATAGAPLPPGVTTATCFRANVLGELSEIAAGLSEFIPIFRPVSTEADPAGPLHTRMAAWFHEIAITGGESFHGALTKMGCSCNCSEIDAHVRATFTEVTASNAWTASERVAFNAQMRLELPIGTRPSWPL